MTVMSSMKAWMQAANPAQQAELAQRASTSRPYLYHLAGRFRDASPDLAKRIEQVTLAMSKETKGKLPAVYRTDLNASCRACEFAQKCLGPAAVRSDFQYLPADDTEGGAI
jgi:hypothetical protein